MRVVVRQFVNEVEGGGEVVCERGWGWWWGSLRTGLRVVVRQFVSGVESGGGEAVCERGWRWWWLGSLWTGLRVVVRQSMNGVEGGGEAVWERGWGWWFGSLWAESGLGEGGGEQWSWLWAGLWGGGGCLWSAWEDEVVCKRGWEVSLFVSRIMMWGVVVCDRGWWWGGGCL